jgi:hypothetical protein
MNKRICYALASVALLATSHAAAQGQSSNLVLLAVDDAESALAYHATGSSHGRCQESSEPGCVRVSGRGEITFRLVGERQCGSNDKWQLSGVELGGENSTSKPGTWGGLSATAAADFNADQATGRISTGTGNSVTIQAANSRAYSVWYRVEASCGGKTIYFDPRLENDGTGSLN